MSRLGEATKSQRYKTCVQVRFCDFTPVMYDQGLEYVSFADI